MATVRFLSDWSTEQSGDVRPGEKLQVEYDVTRLPEHRATRYGQKAWSILAYFRFSPGSEAQSGDISSGTLEVDVPADATQVELWFHNTDHTGGSAWDSRYGQNYLLNVTSTSFQ